MKKDKYIYLLLNIIYLVAIIFVTSKLDLLNENLSSLAKTSRGYFLLLTGGIIGSSLLGYCASKIHNKLFGFLTFMAILLCCLVPNFDNVSSFLNNLHMFCACTGLILITVITLMNILYFQRQHYKLGIILINVFIICFTLAIVIYLHYMMVTTISELIITITLIVIYCVMYIKRDNP